MDGVCVTAETALAGDPSTRIYISTRVVSAALSLRTRAEKEASAPTLTVKPRTKQSRQS